MNRSRIWITRSFASLTPASNPGLRADLLVAVDHDTIGGLEEGQRPARRFALALIDDLHRGADDDVPLVGAGVRHAIAGRLATLLAQRHVVIGFGALELVAG